MSAQARSVLDMATNIAVLAVVMYSGYAVWGARHNPATDGTSPAEKPNYVALARSTRGETPRAVVVAMSTTCEACKESLPFFRQLIQAASKSNGRVGVVLAFPAVGTQAAAVDAFVKANALSNARVVRVKLREFGITSVPSLVIAEKDGSISHSWVGLLGKDQQAAVLQGII